MSVWGVAQLMRMIYGVQFKDLSPSAAFTTVPNADFNDWKFNRPSIPNSTSAGSQLGKSSAIEDVRASVHSIGVATTNTFFVTSSDSS